MTSLHTVLHHVFEKLSRHVQSIIKIGKHLQFPLSKDLVQIALCYVKKL